MKLYEYLGGLSDSKLAEIGQDILNYDESGHVDNESLLRKVQYEFKGESNLNRIISETKYEVLLRFTSSHSKNNS